MVVPQAYMIFTSVKQEIKRRTPCRSRLRVELLEDRTLLATDLLSSFGDLSSVAGGDLAVFQSEAHEVFDLQKLIVAGSPSGSPADSPANRVDANTTGSPFAGVGSLQIQLGADLYICTATAISPWYVLTAGHCLDLNDNGTIDVAPGDVSFILNYGSDYSHVITAAELYIHPDYTGFNNPYVNDDIAVIKLSSPLPAGVPFYAINTDDFLQPETLTMVGYGTSGDGVSGYYVNASFSVKRTGGNVADWWWGDDEGTSAREVFEYDFDGGSAPNYLGSPIGLGNDVETTLGGGDSGGPAFKDDGAGQLEIFGVNTYTFSFSFQKRYRAPKFGSGGGGIVVSYYSDWIFSIVGDQSPQPGVTITQSNGSTNVEEGEGGATDTYDVVLNTAPAGDVTITINPDSELTTNASTLTFTTTNWSTPQTVIVSAVDDSENEGDHTGTISHTVTSADANYNGINVADVTANITDNDQPPPEVFYFSLELDTTGGGISMANEDIISFDGTNFAILFDGSDVGLASARIDAFDVISANEILISFDAPRSIAGISGTVDDSDIVKFTATSLGETTAGSFSMYFDGSDVGLSTNSEDIDALTLLDDGTLLLSIVGSGSANGLSLFQDEDIIRFHPTSLGTNTSGTFSMFLDGSDSSAGLTGSGEDIDGLMVKGSRLYLTTSGNFSVPGGASGADEDIFVFNFFSGLYEQSLFADFSSNDLWGLDFPGTASAAALFSGSNAALFGGNGNSDFAGFGQVVLGAADETVLDSGDLPERPPAVGFVVAAIDATYFATLIYTTQNSLPGKAVFENSESRESTAAQNGTHRLGSSYLTDELQLNHELFDLAQLKNEMTAALMDAHTEIASDADTAVFEQQVAMETLDAYFVEEGKTDLSTATEMKWDRETKMIDSPAATATLGFMAAIGGVFGAVWNDAYARQRQARQTMSVFSCPTGNNVSAGWASLVLFDRRSNDFQRRRPRIRSRA